MTDPVCLLCRGTAFRLLVRTASPHLLEHGLGGRHGRDVAFYACLQCGLVAQHPMLTDAQCRDLYTGRYRDDERPEESLADDAERAALVADWLDGRLGDDGGGRRALDVGCGAGAYLLTLRDRGWRVAGIEPLEAWATVARERGGLPVTTGFYGDGSFPVRSFDLILMSHLIEHLPDPLPALRAARRHLAPGGRLFVGTPNVVLPKLIGGVGSFNAAHVRLYSRNTLARLLALAGFRTTASVTLWPGYGLAVLAEASAEPPPEAPADDANAIAALYLGLLRPDASTALSRNLAALFPRHLRAAEALCTKILLKPFLAVPGDAGMQLAVREPIGRLRSLEAVADLQALDAWLAESLPEPAADAVVVEGRGWWRVLPVVWTRRCAGQRIIVREPDLRVLKLALTVADLSAPLGSETCELRWGATAAGYRLDCAPGSAAAGRIIRDGVPEWPADTVTVQGSA